MGRSVSAYRLPEIATSASRQRPASCAAEIAFSSDFRLLILAATLVCAIAPERSACGR